MPTAKPVEILLYDEIYFGSAKGYIDQIRAAGNAPIHLRISSPGGSIFDGNAIYNALVAHKPGVTCSIDGVAASMATVIMLAASRIVMPSNAMLMIHRPSGGAMGNSEDLRSTADMLDALEKNAIDAYMRRIGDRMTRADFTALLDVDTWLTAEAALALGLIDEIIAPADLKACLRFDTAKLRNAPAALLNAIKQPSPAMSKFILTAALLAALPSAFGAVGLADPKLTEATSEADFLAQLKLLSDEGAKFKAEAAKVTGLTTELADVKGQFTALEGTVAALKTERDTAKGEVTTLTGQLTTTKGELTTATGHVDRLKALCGAKGIDPDKAPPVITDPVGEQKTMKLSEFEKMDLDKRGAFIRGGGKLTD